MPGTLRYSLFVSIAYAMGECQQKNRGPFSSPQHNVSRLSHYYIAADSRLHT